MTVLLIDGVGHVREAEIPCLLRTILVPLPVSFMARIADDDPICAPDAPPVARFDLSHEPSYPPVYRQVPPFSN
jgi:hypothetical protein